MTSKQSLSAVKQSIYIAFWLTFGSLGFAYMMGWITPESINYWEIMATFTSFSCTWMCVKQTRWNYPMAIISTMMLSYVYWEANLLASTALNLYLIPTVIYGWFIWGKDEVTKPVERVRPRILYQYALFTISAYVGAYLIVWLLDGSMAVLDSWLLIGSIFAQFLLDRKKIETWVVWISVNTVSIYVYYNSGLYLLAIQFGFFLMNAVYGYYSWYQTMKKKGNKGYVEI